MRLVPKREKKRARDLALHSLNKIADYDDAVGVLLFMLVKLKEDEIVDLFNKKFTQEP